jgi:hypothetical protein
MNYYYNGKKPSTRLNFTSGCLLIIALAAIIFLFTMIDSLEDLEGHYLELFFVCLMGGSIFYGFVKKKGKLHTYRIEIIKNNLFINDIKIPLENISLEIYSNSNNFSRYHLWDSKGILSIYSVYEDDLFKNLKNTFPKKIKTHKEISSSQDGASVSVTSEGNQLSYNLDSGKFKIKEKDKTIFNKTPRFFIYDPKYKQGKGLTKK